MSGLVMTVNKAASAAVAPFFARRAQKRGKLITSHRYNLVPLLPSDPGGIPRELVV